MVAEIDYSWLYWLMEMSNIVMSFPISKWVYIRDFAKHMLHAMVMWNPIKIKSLYTVTNPAMDLVFLYHLCCVFRKLPITGIKATLQVTFECKIQIWDTFSTNKIGLKKL